MKVVHFLTSIDKASGGVTAYLELLSRELKHNVDLVIATGISPSPIKIDDVRVDFFDLSLANILKISKLFRNYLENQKPDLVHINGIWEPQNWLFQKEASRLGIKVILSPHGMLEPYILKRNPLKKKIALLLYQKKAIELADYIHATAISEKENIKKNGFSNESIVIPNGVDLSEINEKQEWGSNEKTKFLFLSRIHPKKGIEILIESVQEISKEDVVFYIAGEGKESYVNELKQIVTDKKLGEKIIFLGGVYGKEKWDLYKNSDIFVLPTHSENFGIVIAEALATGVPVITTKGTPWSELEENNCGWWIDLSVKNVKKAIEEAIELTNMELKEKGKNGRKLVLDKYDIKSVSPRMYEFYQKIN